MTTSHQSSSPQAAAHTLVFPDFLLWEMSRVKHKTGGNVHHCSTVSNILPRTAAFLAAGKECFFLPKHPLFVHSAHQQPALHANHGYRKMLIEKMTRH